MKCDHFRKDKINRKFNKQGRLVEYDLACSTCASLLGHYKYGIKTRDYQKNKVFKVTSFVIDFIDNKFLRKH